MKQKDKYKHLSFEEKESLFAWFRSQQRWHMRQPPSKWHSNQAQWFKNNANWLFSFGDLAQRCIPKHVLHFHENVMKNNILLAKLAHRGINNYERKTS